MQDGQLVCLAMSGGSGAGAAALEEPDLRAVFCTEGTARAGVSCNLEGPPRRLSETWIEELERILRESNATDSYACLLQRAKRTLHPSDLRDSKLMALMFARFGFDLQTARTVKRSETEVTNTDGSKSLQINCEYEEPRTMSPAERYELYMQCSASLKNETALLPSCASLHWRARNKWIEVALVSWIRGLIKIDELLKQKNQKTYKSINEMLGIDGALEQSSDASDARKRPRLK